MTPSGGPPVRVYVVEAAPRRAGPALVAGRVWIEAATGAVVRLAVRYVGSGLFQRKGTERFVSVDLDLEYALLEGRHWLPFRQTVAGRVRVPLLEDLVVPFQAVTTFHDHEINTGRPITFQLPLPDSSLPPASLRRLRQELRDSVRAARQNPGAGPSAPTIGARPTDGTAAASSSTGRRTIRWTDTPAGAIRCSGRRGRG